jgi:hypothetical protein
MTFCLQLYDLTLCERIPLPTRCHAIFPILPASFYALQIILKRFTLRPVHNRWWPTLAAYTISMT